MSVDEAINQVLRVTGKEENELLPGGRGRCRNPARTVAVWWMVEGAGLTRVEVGKRMQLSDSGVCRAIRRVRSERVRNPTSDLVKWSQALEQPR